MHPGRVHRTAFAIAVVLTWPASYGVAQPRTFRMTADAGSRIQFVSDAPLETITGVSTEVSGAVTFDPDDLSSAQGTISVPVASIRTGSDLRDEHLRRDTWLDAARNPDATFEITRVEGATRLTRGEVTSLRLHGRFSIHGRTREIVATAHVRLVSESEMSARASVRVLLTDYDVSVPLPVRLKVSDEIRVNVRIRARVGDG